MKGQQKNTFNLKSKAHSGATGWFVFSCAAFLATLPFETRFTNFAIVAMTASWLLGSGIKSKWSHLKQNSLGHWIFVLYAMSMATVLYSDNKGFALDRLETGISLVIIGLIVFSSNLSFHQIHHLLDVFVFTTLLTALYCLGWSLNAYLETANPNSFFYHWFTTPLDVTAIYFANFVCTSIIILLFSGGYSPIPSTARIALATTMIGLVFLLAALSVTGFLVCLGLIGGWFSFRRRFSAIKSLAFMTITGIILAGILWTFPYTKAKVEKIGSLEYEMSAPDSMWNTVTIRLAKWKGATEVIKDHPVLGVGIGDAEDMLMQSYAELNFKEGLRNTYNEHNQYLANWIAMGLPGVLILIATLGVPMCAALKRRDYLLLTFLSLMAVTFFTENFLFRQKGIMFFAFFYALLITRSNLARANFLKQKCANDPITEIG